MIIPVTYGISPHIPTYIYIYDEIWVIYGLIPTFEWDYMGYGMNYGLYIYDKSRIRFVGCPAPRTVESLETRRENFALALAGQLSVFFCRTSERTERSDLSETEFFSQICMGFHVQLILYLYIYIHMLVSFYMYMCTYIYIYVCVCVITHTYIYSFFHI